MKRLALLSVVALMLASAVFAPVAMAQTTPGEVDIQTVTLGPGGSLHVTGTIVCEPGAEYALFLEARQTQGNQPVRFGEGSTPFTVDCQTTTGLALETFTVDVLPGPGSKPFRKGEVTLSGGRFYCGPNGCGEAPIALEVFELARAQ
jgi:hypothetical protein